AEKPYSLESVTMSFLPAHFSRTSEPGSRTWSFLRKRPLTALKSAVLAPMPSASDRTTTDVQPLSRSSARTPWRRSLSIGPPNVPSPAGRTLRQTCGATLLGCVGRYDTCPVVSRTRADD